MIKKVALLNCIKGVIIMTMFFLIIGCTSNKYPNSFIERDIYKIETEYLGENLVDSCIQSEKIFFKDGRYSEIEYTYSYSTRICHYDKNGKIIMDIFTYKSKTIIQRCFYDRKGNEKKIVFSNLDLKPKGIAKRKNYYGSNNRIKRQICYDIYSNIEDIYNFYYDTLEYAMVIDRMSGKDYSDIAQTDYYQNGLLVKSVRFFGRDTLEYKYDNLGRFIYEDCSPIKRCYYSYIGDLLNKTVNVTYIDNVIKDTISTTTYHYLFDSLQRPIQTIATTISDRDTTEKKVTITEYR